MQFFNIFEKITYEYWFILSFAYIVVKFYDKRVSNNKWFIVLSQEGGLFYMENNQGNSWFK